MATNNFLQFATAGGANVEDQATYAADSQRTAGNQPGVASSALNNKALRQANYVTSNLAQMMADFTGSDVLDDTVTAKFLSILKASVQVLAPIPTRLTSGTGTYNLPYYFFIATGSATTGATYTNNGATFTVSATIASGTLLTATGNGAPAVSGTLTKSGGTGDSTITFYAFRAPLYLHVRAMGGGGGGGGATANNGSDGNDTTFGAAITAGKGGHGLSGNNGGGLGGTATVTGSATVVALVTANGGQGDCGLSGTGLGGYGGMGAPGPFGGAAAGNGSTNIGSLGNGATNSGSGGSGGAVASTASGGGGGAGAYCEAILLSPSATYSWVVGAGGAGGAAGGNAGGNGGSGIIIVMAHFQ